MVILGVEKSFSYLSVYYTTGGMSVVTHLGYLFGSAYLVRTIA
jgi:hypothetical protein